MVCVTSTLILADDGDTILYPAKTQSRCHYQCHCRRRVSLPFLMCFHFHSPCFIMSHHPSSVGGAFQYRCMIPSTNNYRCFIKLTSIAHLPARQRQPQVGGLQGPPSREEAHIALLSRRGRDIPGEVQRGRGRGVVHVSPRCVCVVEDLLLTFDNRQVSICAWRWDDGKLILTGALLVGSDMSNATRRNLHAKTV